MPNIIVRFKNATQYYFTGLYTRLGNDHAYLMSGGLAFSLFACAVPFALVVMSVVGSLYSSPDVANEIFATIDRLVPYPEQAASIKEFLAHRFSEMSSMTQLFGVVGVIWLFFASTGLFSSLRTILNRVFRFRKTESILIGKLWDIAMVLLVLVLAVVLMMALPAIEAITGWASQFSWLENLQVTGLGEVLLNMVALIVLVIVFSVIFWLVPVRKPRKRAVLVGATVSAILWLTAKYLFGYYLSHALTLKHIYGVYTFIVAAGFWLYYSALILIIGAESGQLSYERKREREKAEAETKATSIG